MYVRFGTRENSRHPIMNRNERSCLLKSTMDGVIQEHSLDRKNHCSQRRLSLHVGLQQWSRPRVIRACLRGLANRSVHEYTAMAAHRNHGRSDKRKKNRFRPVRKEFDFITL